jgi:hypothetical protein
MRARRALTILGDDGVERAIEDILGLKRSASQEDCMAPLRFGLSARAIPEPSASSHQKIEPDHDQRAERNADEDAQRGIKHAS